MESKKLFLPPLSLTSIDRSLLESFYATISHTYAQLPNTFPCCLFGGVKSALASQQLLAFSFSEWVWGGGVVAGNGNQPGNKGAGDNFTSLSVPLSFLGIRVGGAGPRGAGYPSVMRMYTCMLVHQLSSSSSKYSTREFDW